MDDPEGGRKEEGRKFQETQKLLMAFLPIYDSYHNQKENMAYLAATLYLAGASTLYFQTPFWLDYTHVQLLLLILFLLTFTIFVFLFIAHQLDLRRAAGYMFRACSDLLSSWIAAAPDLMPREPDEDLWRCVEFPDSSDPLFGKAHLPAVLANQIQRLKSGSKSRWWASDYTFAIVGSTGLLVLAKIIYLWIKARH